MNKKELIEIREMELITKLYDLYSKIYRQLLCDEQEDFFNEVIAGHKNYLCPGRKTYLSAKKDIEAVWDRSLFPDCEDFVERPWLLISKEHYIGKALKGAIVSKEPEELIALFHDSGMRGEFFIHPVSARGRVKNNRLTEDCEVFY